MVEIDSAQIDLTGQVAIVTGGGRGLGRAMAHALARANAAVAVVARTEAQLVETVAWIREAGGQAIEAVADVTDKQAVDRMIQTVQQRLGPIDILVNNAGVARPVGPIWENDPDEWRQTLEVNLTSAFLCSAAVLKNMIRRRRGRIINVASGAALGPIPFGSAYVVSKAALLRLTECIAADVKDYGITAFAIDPGSVRTAMTEYLIESEEGRSYLPWYREFILAGNDVPADLSAHLVAFLASGRADRLSGRLVRVSDNVGQLVLQAQQITDHDLYTLRLGTLPPGAQ